MKRTYIVTEKAGQRVNGQRVLIGQRLVLSEREAKYHRDLGEIELAPLDPAAPEPAPESAPEADQPAAGKAKR